MGVDYLTVSMPRVEGAGKVFLSLSQLLQAKPDGTVFENGYEGVLCCAGYGRLLLRQDRYGPAADILVRLPGRALEWMRDLNVFSDSDTQCTDADICRFFIDHGFRCTRIDVAMDSSDPELSPQLIERHLREKRVTCRARQAGSNVSWELGGELLGAATIYIGGRTSGRFMRVYDKRAEVLQKTGRDIAQLTRFELENKYHAATPAMRLIAEKGVGCIRGLFRGWIDFKDLTDEVSRVERCSSAAWWERVVGDAAPINLGLTRGVATPEKSLQWIRRQVAKTLFFIEEFGLEKQIRHAVAEKKFKVKESELAKWQHFAEKLPATRDFKPWEESNAAK